MKFCVRNFQIKIEGKARMYQVEGNYIRNLSILEKEFVKKNFASFLSVTPNYLYIK